MPIPEEVMRALRAAHQEALRVGDSPLRADQLAAKLPGLLRDVEASELSDETMGRIRAALEDADRRLRRDDDGREAARYLEAVIRLAGERPRPPSPFGPE